MKCTKCNRKMEILDSRTTRDGMVRRRRHCSRCDNRETTYEVSAGSLASMREELQSLRSIRRSLGLPVEREKK